MRRFARFTQEAAFGVYKTSDPVAIHPRLSANNSIGIMEAPDFYTIMDGSGRGVQAMAGTPTTRIEGTLVTELGPTVAPFLASWAGVRVNDGQTAPWVTTEMPLDLASCTVDLGRAKFNAAALKRTRYLGMKVGSLGLACSKDQPKLLATIGMVGSKFLPNPWEETAGPDAIAFPEPACSDQPWDVYLFQQLKGKVTVGGVSRSNFESFSLQLQNQLAVYWDEDRFANAIRCVGRTLTATVRLRDKTSPDDWTTYLSGTPGAASFEFADGTGNTLKFDFKGNTYISGIEQDLPLDAEPYYTLTITNQLDPSTCVDFTVETTVPTPPGD